MTSSSLLASGILYYFECLLCSHLTPSSCLMGKNHVLPFLYPSMDSQCLSLAHSMYSGNIYLLKNCSQEKCTQEVIKL